MLRIILPNKQLLLLIQLKKRSLMIKELLWHAFGRESFNCCLLLSFNLLLGRPFLFFLRCPESLIKIRKLLLRFGN